MDIIKRREGIIAILKNEKEPITAVSLGEKFDVSRQVIVNDIAFIREMGEDIISTNRGYILDKGREHSKVIKVKHSYDDTKNELYAIVDAGVKIVDVFVEHDYYGRISADLDIENRLEVDRFISKIEDKETNYLNHLTEGVHFHTLESDSEDALVYAIEKLKKLGYLVE